MKSKDKTHSTSTLEEKFNGIAENISCLIGKGSVFLLALFFILVWGITGPLFHYSDTWQLVVNTTTSVITFLIVFLIQNTQNRNDKITQLKLDELIKSIDKADNPTINLEELTDEQLQLLERKYKQFAKKHGKDN